MLHKLSILFLKRLNTYLSKHHQWVIGILIAIIIPLIIYGLQKNDTLGSGTKTYYFVNYQQQKETQKLKEASCWTSSISSNRSDAFRCSVEQSIYDPCFKDSNDIIDCPLDPALKSQRLFRLSLDSLAENNNENIQEKSEIIPWFIVLHNRQRCMLYTGVTDLVADRRIDFGCTKGKYDFLQLPIIKDEKEWKIGCRVDNRIEDCSIKEVWY